jgi:tetratricopeptide (TPR) repeat protein
MIKYLISKILGKSKKKELEFEKKSPKLNAVRSKSDEFLKFLSKKAEQSFDEAKIVSQKLKNLEETNFELGRLHIKKGNINEAIFRFRLIRFIYPDNLDAYYELAYCLVLKNKFTKSQKVLEELLAKDPNYHGRAFELLDYLKNLQN